jgi:hypothetical protein
MTTQGLSSDAERETEWKALDLGKKPEVKKYLNRPTVALLLPKMVYDDNTCSRG